jgi:TonB family protein
MNTAVAPQRWEGQIVDGKFRLVQWLGGTGQSTVFRTEIPGQGRKAAIKLVPADASSAEQIARWQTAAQLSHPNLLHIFAAGNCRINSVPLIYVVTELADEDLSEVLPQRALSTDEIEQMMGPLLDVIKYLHQQGLVHGKIQPSNVLAVGDRLKLSSDSLRSPDGAAPKRDGFNIYEAPEIAVGAATPAADVWSVGATLVAALTQHLPKWDQRTLVDPGVPESMPEPFRQIARECLRRNPDERCTLQQIQARLKEAQQAAKPHLVEVAPAPKESRTKVWAATLVLVILAVLFAARWIARSTQQESVNRTTGSTEAPSGSSTSSTPGTNLARSGVGGQGGVVEKVMPDVARSARMTVHGKIRVRVRLEVDPSGGVSRSNLITPGPSRYFANLAQRASEKWKFQPAQVNGQAVPSEWVITYLFSRNGTEVSPQQVKP